MEAREIEFFLKQMRSNAQRAYQGGIVLTAFLDEQQQYLLKQNLSKEVVIYLDGGFENAERKRAIFTSGNGVDVNYKIAVYKILYNKKYLVLTHRMILGCLMGLGIKRESIGDIVLKKDNAYFAVTKEIAPFVFSQWKTIRGIPIELEEVKEQIQAERQMEIKTHIVSSLRLDCIVASAYKKSRSEVDEMIQAGLVFLNHIECKSGSKLVSVSDVISVRHKGRVYIEEIGGKTKSDRFMIQLGFLV